MLRTQPPHVVAEPRDRPGPADPLSDHRRRHVRRRSASSCRTSGSNGVNDVGTAGRSYFGGRSEANARATVDLPDPQIPRDLTLRNTVRDQPPDQSPILH